MYLLTHYMSEQESSASKAVALFTKHVTYGSHLCIAVQVTGFKRRKLSFIIELSMYTTPQRQREIAVYFYLERRAFVTIPPHSAL
jgi:hypothetical protein